MDTVTVLFTDWVDSTGIRARLGEDAADELRRIHDALLAAGVGANDGTVVKGLGDGVLVMFAGAAEAVAAGVAMQRAVDLLARRDLSAMVTHRFGVGEFGAAVDLLQSSKECGKVLITFGGTA
jgi:class 3 adenylate cyclase